MIKMMTPEAITTALQKNNYYYELHCEA